MKKLPRAAIAFVAVSLMGVGYWITRDEALVSAALTELKFESVPPKPAVVGAPPKFKVTKQTIDHLQILLKEGKTIEVEGNGSLKILTLKK
jgi:hypothetical protein